MPLPDVGDLYKDLVWESVWKAVLAKIVVAVPWMGLPIIGTFVEWIFGMIATALFDGAMLFLDMQMIPIKNEAHRRAYDTACVSLKIIARDKGIDSPEFKSERHERQKAMRAFTSIPR